MYITQWTSIFQLTNACMLQNQASVKESFKVQDRPVDFNVVEYGKFIDAVSDSILQWFLRNYQLTGFDVIFFSFLTSAFLLHNLDHNLKVLLVPHSLFLTLVLSSSRHNWFSSFFLNSFILRYFMVIKFTSFKSAVLVSLQSCTPITTI